MQFIDHYFPHSLKHTMSHYFALCILVAFHASLLTATATATATTLRPQQRSCNFISTSSTALNSRIKPSSSSSSTRLFLAKKTTTSGKTSKKNKQKLPKLIIFDLDGCLWSPEMYEILHFMGGKGSPFTTDDQDKSILRSSGGDPVRLLGNVRDVMYELYYDSKWCNTDIGISSRTDEPNWARELLDKFLIYKMASDNDNRNNNKNDDEKHLPPFQLKEVFNNDICVLKDDSKAQHFEQIIKNAPGKPKYEDCLFFDNELGNCCQIANLGVTVCYCPKGVTIVDWNTAISNFPTRNGKVIGN